MIKFFEKVDTRSRSKMISFLKDHFRYHTMNTWNQVTSYGNNIKIHYLDLPEDIRDNAYEILEQGDVHEEVNYLLNDFATNHDYLWLVGQNGRSSGYFVLYRGGKELSEHKSYCTACRQKNFTSVKESGNKQCGNCDALARVDYDKPQYNYFPLPGKDVDQDEDFYDWDMDSLKSRVKLVQEFDQLCDDCISLFTGYCKDYKVVKKEIMVPKTIQVLESITGEESP